MAYLLTLGLRIVLYGNFLAHILHTLLYPHFILTVSPTTLLKTGFDTPDP
jgi:hypothetical protein